MPAWIASALALLFGTRVRTALTTGTAATLAGGLDIPFIGDGDAPKKRRRRRRALTASDRADIGFIVGLLGANAGKNFAITIATRTG